jgi:hypothetical protein
MSKTSPLTDTGLYERELSDNLRPSPEAKAFLDAHPQVAERFHSWPNIQRWLFLHSSMSAQLRLLEELRSQLLRLQQA